MLQRILTAARAFRYHNEQRPSSHDRRRPPASSKEGEQGALNQASATLGRIFMLRQGKAWSSGFALAVSLCFGASAAAQETQRAPEAATDPSATEEVTAPRATPKKTAEEEIVVTGTRVRRKDLLTPAPVTVTSREQVVASGKVSTGDFLQSLP